VEPPYKLSRRKFIESALIAAAAGGSGVGCVSRDSPWRFLSVAEARTLSAACDQIIPPDETPGAAWAGVVNFIDRQLCGHLRHLRNSYRNGLAALNQSSRILYECDFAFLSSEKQLELLTKLEQGQAPREAWQKVSSTEFFAMMVNHSMQGFYGDPRHGGNRERVSWKMVGLSYPPIRGRLHYDLTKS
jgi:gluconate 2-dehydrogenase gamma chain